MKLVKRRKVLIIVIAILFILILFFAFRSDIKVVSYSIESLKIHDDIKIAFVADLHSCDYGEGQVDLLNMMKKAEPDIVLLGGDIVDDHLPRKKAMEFISVIAEQYPCYYVSGNHEFWSGDIDYIKREIEACGITVLEGEKADINVNGQSLSLFGIDDPEVGGKEFLRQLKYCGEHTDEDHYSILLTHRPERFSSYLTYDFDLILAGHTHGGQMRIPPFVNGLFAPDQGWFPKYAGGLYQFDGTQLIVSRGLARESTRAPRIFNRPELVIVSLMPKSE